MQDKEITAETLRELISYDPSTGVCEAPVDEVIGKYRVKLEHAKCQVNDDADDPFNSLWQKDADEFRTILRALKEMQSRQGEALANPDDIIGYYYVGLRDKPREGVSWLSVAPNDHWPTDQWVRIEVTPVLLPDGAKFAFVAHPPSQPVELSDDEIDDLYAQTTGGSRGGQLSRNFARAVIAADRKLRGG